MSSLRSQPRNRRSHRTAPTGRVAPPGPGITGTFPRRASPRPHRRPLSRAVAQGSSSEVPPVNEFWVAACHGGGLSDRVRQRRRRSPCSEGDRPRTDGQRPVRASGADRERGRRHRAPHRERRRSDGRTMALDLSIRGGRPALYKSSVCPLRGKRPNRADGSYPCFCALGNLPRAIDIRSSSSPACVVSDGSPRCWRQPIPGTGQVDAINACRSWRSSDLPRYGPWREAG